MLASCQGRNWVEHHLDAPGSAPGLFYRQKGLYSVLTAPVTLHSMWLEVGVHAEEAERRSDSEEFSTRTRVNENKLEQGTAELLSGLNAQCVYNSGGCGKHSLRPSSSFLSPGLSAASAKFLSGGSFLWGLFCYSDGGLGL